MTQSAAAQLSLDGGTEDTGQMQEAAEAENIRLSIPPLPSLLTAPLGLEGWAKLEPVLLAALVTEEPMLLIGPHGAAKSFMLERLSQVLGMEYRFYNASLLNYDDLVGIPMPDASKTSIKYISSPTAIWDAEIAFIDEISRTRPDLQNKLFPIIHEKRVQGMELKRLRYRWAAMNPPPPEDGSDDNLDMYFGSEPLDVALADRFSFILQVPSWQELTLEQKRSVLSDQFCGEHPFDVTPQELIERAAKRYRELVAKPPAAIAEYVISVLASLEGQKIVCSARRATMMHRNILAVHAARMAFYESAWPEVPYNAIDWCASALTALTHSLPHLAQGMKPDPTAVLMAHRQAWELTRIDETNPWRKLLAISDPRERCLVALEMEDQMSDDDLSHLILDALSSEDNEAERTALALAVYLAVKTTRPLRAAVYEALAQILRPVLRVHSEKQVTTPKSHLSRSAALAEKLRKEASNDGSPMKLYGANVVVGLALFGKYELAPTKAYSLFRSAFTRLSKQPKKEISK